MLLGFADPMGSRIFSEEGMGSRLGGKLGGGSGWKDGGKSVIGMCNK